MLRRTAMQCRWAVIAMILVLVVGLLMPGADAIRYGKDTSIDTVDASYNVSQIIWRSISHLSIAGDVNDDGYDDMLVCEPYDGGQKGRVFLILGHRTGWTWEAELDSAIVFTGEKRYDQLGWDADIVHDINGDGIDDMLMAASRYATGGETYGKVYVVFGRKSGWAPSSNISLVADASFIGTQQGDNLGDVMAAGKDVNGDGIGDIVFGLIGHNHSPTSNSNGTVNLFFGKKTGWAKDVPVDDADSIFYGKKYQEFAGHSVAFTGDMNGDGFGDLAIGAIGSDNGGSHSGTASIIFGRATGWPSDLNLSQADAFYYGENMGDMVGDRMAGVGDINGDHLNDLVVYALGNEDGGGHYSGKIYIIFGSETGLGKDLSLKGYPSLVGQTPYDDPVVNGDSIAPAGDVNGDGFSDLLVGDEYEDKNGDNSGTVYLVLGKKDGWVANQPLVQASSASFVGTGAEEGLGYALAGQGDLNGDGTDDIAIAGLWGTENPPVLPSRAYIIFPLLSSDPKPITSLKAYSDEGYSIPVTTAAIGDRIYVELVGKDVSSNLPDVVVVNVTSSKTSKNGFLLSLAETAKNTGVYRGNFVIWEHMDPTERAIGAKGGENVTVTSVDDKTKKVTIDIRHTIKISPCTGKMYATEDIEFRANFSTLYETAISWRVDGASFLSWDATMGQVRGIPRNNHVGTHQVSLIVTGLNGTVDKCAFELVVANTPPEILTKDKNSTLEDMPYLSDYSSSDDGQGNITWYLSSNASWLSMNQATGMLAGDPKNSDVGTYNVTVTVKDGNGGTDSANFLLEVLNVNDPPVWSLVPNSTSLEVGQLFSFDAKALDIDVGDVVEYGVLTEPASNLVINRSTGRIVWTASRDGIPDNVDFRLKVSINASDGKATIWHVFNISVHLHNEPPTLDAISDQTVYAKERFSHQTKAHDTDPGDEGRFNYTIEGPAGMTIDAKGKISWTPGSDMVGTHKVTVRVTDGKAWGSTSFNITVKKPRGSVTTSTECWLIPVLVLIMILVLIIVVTVYRVRRGRTP